MATDGRKPIRFLVHGREEETSRAELTSGTDLSLAQDSTRYFVKQAVSLESARAGEGEIGVEVIPGEDVVELDIAGGPTLVLHPLTARDLMLAQGISAREARQGADVLVPKQLRWRGLESTLAEAEGRGSLGGVLLKAVRVIGGKLKTPAARVTAKAIVERFDKRVEEGVYRLNRKQLIASGDGIEPIEKVEASGNDPLLVLIHGTFTTTPGTFSRLWTEHPELVGRIFDRYGDRVYALDHATLGSSPIRNALTLAHALPAGASVHLLTHSRGGLVAEVLARACGDATADVKAFEGDSYLEQRRELAELVAVANEKRLRVRRMVRVACPARGTLLASGRLDAYLSVIRWLISASGLPVVPEILAFLGEVARRRTEPEEMPGLAAQLPDSPLVQWLHAAPRPLEGDLRVIAGDLKGDSVGSWLKTLMSDGFFWTDNDLVVQTSSMYGGAPRKDGKGGEAAPGASFILDQNGAVSHFAYFANQRTSRAVVDALLEENPKDFRKIGPLSAAGLSSTGSRAARTSPDRPAVFVLPGILGSNLRVGNERIWLGWRIINGLDQLAYTSGATGGKTGRNPVQPDGSIDHYYEKLIRHLEATHEVREFAFDWRLPMEEEARRLADQVEAAVEARQDTEQPVRIIAHSMGGLLARTMWLERPDVWRMMMSHGEARVLMLGTPNEGSWAPMQVLSGDDTFGNTLAMVGAPFRQRQAREVMAGFPGFLQLQASLPGDRYKLDTAAGWKKLADEDLRRLEKLSLWHVRKFQLDAYGWGVPSQSVLERAVELRRRLDEQRDKDLPEFASKLALVVGSAPYTPNGIEISDRGLVYLDAASAGDGRVTLAASMLPGVRTWQVECDHGTLPQHRDAFEAYEELLRTGSTEHLPEVTASRGLDSIVHVRSRPSRVSPSTLPPQAAEDLLKTVVREEEPPPRTAALRITVVNGDLTFVAEPLMLGHYRAMKLSGTERTMDKLLGGKMGNALRLGLYPSEPEQTKSFINEGRSDDPFRLPRPEAVIVVGLGPEGDVRSSQLIATVRKGVIAWAEHAMELKRAGTGLRLAATLIGSGGAGISAGQSAQLIAQGVHEANEFLARIGNDPQEDETGDDGPQNVLWPQVEQLDLIELYLDRALEAWRALRLQADASPERYRLEDNVKNAIGALTRPLDADYRGADYDFMSVESRPDDEKGPSISYRLATRRARTELHAQVLQGSLVENLISGASNGRSSDQQIGKTLFQLLVPIELEPYLSGSTELLLEVDGRSAGIPWEILDTPAIAGGDDRPWALRSKLLRKLRTDEFRRRPVDATAEAGILIVGEPACDDLTSHPRLNGARREAIEVANCLTKALGSPSQVRRLFPDDVETVGSDGPSVIKALMAGPWRVLHIAGHGELPVSDKIPRGVVLSDGLFLGRDEIESMRVVPELVFVNCCFLAARKAKETFQLLERPRFAANVAEALIRMGVRCVVAAGWAVQDHVAHAFAVTFYSALTRGMRFLDAVNEARSVAFEMGGNTWAAYQCYGDPDWQFRPDVSDPQRRSIRMDDLDRIPSAAILELALKELSIQGKRHGELKTQRVRLEHLEARFGQRWGGNGSVAEAFGIAWDVMGERPRAIEWYERALQAEEGLSDRAVEQLNNLKVREAWSRLEKTPEQDRKGAIIEARKTITASIGELARLLETRRTLERLNLLGSAYKRLAMVERMAGRRKEEDKAVARMHEHYATAERLAETRQLDDRFYPAMNRLAADLVVNGRNGSNGSRKAAFDSLRRSLEEKTAVDPDFWSVVGQTELMVYEALAGDGLASHITKILGNYRDVYQRLSTTSTWGSVYDQMQFVLPAYVRTAAKTDREAATKLLEYLSELAGQKSNGTGNSDSPGESKGNNRRPRST